MKPTALDRFKTHLRPGRVYRREESTKWSKAVDRHLKEPTATGAFKKFGNGLYCSPRKFGFGEAPADEHDLVQAFLRSGHFVMLSPNLFNRLGLGTTQLYNKRVVYNGNRSTQKRFREFLAQVHRI